MARTFPTLLATQLRTAEKLIGEAIEFHLDGMREDGDSIPEPTTIATYIEMPTV